jgi:hypothetical protein
MRENFKYDPSRPETVATSWVASILVISYIASLAFSSVLPATPQQTCTVIVECLERPMILPTNALLHRAVVVTLKTEVKFLGRLLHKYIDCRQRLGLLC